MEVASSLIQNCVRITNITRQLVYSNLYESCLRTSLEMHSLKYLYDNYRVLNSDYWLEMTWILFRLTACSSVMLLLNKLSELRVLVI